MLSVWGGMGGASCCGRGCLCGVKWEVLFAEVVMCCLCGVEWEVLLAEVVVCCVCGMEWEVLLA